MFFSLINNRNKIDCIIWVIKCPNQKSCLFDPSNYLPTNLQLSIEDDEGNTVLQAQAREQDNWIQLAFEAEVGECFAVVITLDDSQIKQSFVV